MIPAMLTRRLMSPHFTSLLQLTATILVVGYMLIIGGSFDATVRFRTQLLNAVAGGAVALIWLSVRLWQRARLRLTGLELPLIALALSQWIAVATSSQPRLSLEAAASVVVWGIAFLVLCDLLAHGWPRVYVINALLLAALLVTAQALWEVVGWFALWAGLGQLPPVAFRLIGFLGHSNLTAAALNLLLPLVIAQMLRASRWAARLALGALGLAMLAAEFFSSSRAGWIAGAMMLGLMAAVLGWDGRERLRRWAMSWQSRPLYLRLSLTALVVGLLAVGGWLLVRQAQHASHGSLLARRGYWGPAWNIFIAHPLAGAGPDLYPWLYPRAASVPPAEIVPHAHSLIFQLLSGSGLIGLGALFALVAAGGMILWKRWTNEADRTLAAATLASLVGASVHHLFDYFFNAPAFVFLFVAISALAFASREESPPARSAHPALVALPLALVMGITVFALRGAAWNDQGLLLAAHNDWAAAAQAFRRAAEADPGFTLYWEEAAQASTRAGEASAAIPLWKRAAHDEPDWALPQATLAVLTHDPTAMQPALDLAPQSSLFALNAGALLEARGDANTSHVEYRRALTLSPNLAHGLFWSQTRLRAEALAEWQATQPPDASSLAQGWAALEAGDAEKARVLFEQAHAENLLSNKPYLGLARAYWALGDEARAGHYLRVGQNLPVYTIEETLAFQLSQGDWAAAQGDRAGALTAYTAVFDAYNDYTSAGPGTYGYPWRSWVVFHRAALPSDLVPQFVRADITAEMDTRFARLAQWYVEDGQHDTACYILERVHREAPISESGELWQRLCP